MPELGLCSATAAKSYPFTYSSNRSSMRLSVTTMSPSRNMARSYFWSSGTNGMNSLTRFMRSQVIRPLRQLHMARSPEKSIILVMSMTFTSLRLSFWATHGPSARTYRSTPFRRSPQTSFMEFIA